MNKNGCVKHCRLPKEVTPELANLMGYIEGDGTLDPASTTVVLFSHKELELVEHYLPLMENAFELDRPSPEKRPGLLAYRYHRKKVTAWFLEKGLKSGKWEHGHELCWLRGLFTADGTVSMRGNPSIEGTNLNLMQTVSQILTRHGVQHSVYDRKARLMSAGYQANSTKIVHVTKVGVPIFKKMIGFDLKSKQERLL